MGLGGFRPRADTHLMRALLLDKTPKLVDDYPTPEPSPGQALVRVALASICNTDLELIRGYAPAEQAWHGVLGHEFVGVIEQAPGAEHWEGQRVVGDILKLNLFFICVNLWLLFLVFFFYFSL